LTHVHKLIAQMSLCLLRDTLMSDLLVLVRQAFRLGRCEKHHLHFCLCHPLLLSTLASSPAWREFSACFEYQNGIQEFFTVIYYTALGMDAALNLVGLTPMRMLSLQCAGLIHERAPRAVDPCPEVDDPMIVTTDPVPELSSSPSPPKLSRGARARRNRAARLRDLEDWISQHPSVHSTTPPLSQLSPGPLSDSEEEMQDFSACSFHPLGCPTDARHSRTWTTREMLPHELLHLSHQITRPEDRH
jgi:hypothetical protein